MVPLIRALLLACLVAIPAAAQQSVQITRIPPTAWTPGDASAGGLTLTVNSATYTKIGNICTLIFSVTYPSTSDTNNAQWNGVPAACTFMTSQNTSEAGIVGAQTAGAQVALNLSGGASSTIFIMRTAAVAATNANLTGATLRGSITVVTAN